MSEHGFNLQEIREMLGVEKLPEGRCVVCGKMLTEERWKASEVCCAAGPEGSILFCASHTLANPESKEYKDALRVIAFSKAQQFAQGGN